MWSRSLCDSLIVLQEHVVVEAALDGGAVAEAASVHSLHGFTKDVSTGVPVHLRNFEYQTLVKVWLCWKG